MKGGWPVSSTPAVCGRDGKRKSDPGDQGKEGLRATGMRMPARIRSAKDGAWMSRPSGLRF